MPLRHIYQQPVQAITLLRRRPRQRIWDHTLVWNTRRHIHRQVTTITLQSTTTTIIKQFIIPDYTMEAKGRWIHPHHCHSRLLHLQWQLYRLHHRLGLLTNASQHPQQQQYISIPWDKCHNIRILSVVPVNHWCQWTVLPATVVSFINSNNSSSINTTIPPLHPLTHFLASHHIMAASPPSKLQTHRLAFLVVSTH